MTAADHMAAFLARQPRQRVDFDALAGAADAGDSSLAASPRRRRILADAARTLAHRGMAILPEGSDNDVKLTEWITTARAIDLPHLRSFTNGLEIDRSAVNADLTLPYHNGRTEGINTRTKRIMRQILGRAGFDLLRHRILLP